MMAEALWEMGIEDCTVFVWSIQARDKRRGSHWWNGQDDRIAFFNGNLAVAEIERRSPADIERDCA